MAKVVNINELRKLFIDLGWDNLPVSEVADWIHVAGIDPVGFLAYCKAILANPDGLEDTTVTALPAAQEPYVKEYLQGKKVLI